MSQEIKEQLYQVCKAFLQERLDAVKGIITNVQESLQSETKSSAGDKHETGRAMLQLEREKAGKQLAALQIQQELLAKVTIDKPSEVIRLGSLVQSNKGTFFIAISKGQINIANDRYFAIAPNAPIGQLLLGKKEGDSVQFNDTTIKIKEVV